MNKGMSGYRFTIMAILAIILVGLVLRYGRSSGLILTDINNLFGTLTLQNKGTLYYGP